MRQRSWFRCRILRTLNEAMGPLTLRQIAIRTGQKEALDTYSREYQTLRVTMHRLQHEMFVRRVRRGIYEIV